MVVRRSWLIVLAPLCLVAVLGFAVFAQPMGPMGQYPSSLLSGLRWRDVGPMRGGRTYAVAGHADQPDTFYSGSVGGGVWKTENSGRTWFPVSDEGIPIGSIGAIAVAPSNPDIVYVGTGEPDRSEEHTSELQSLRHLVCRLLLEKKNIHGTADMKVRITETTDGILNGTRHN